MKRGREQYIKNRKFRIFFEKNVNLYENEKVLDVGLEQFLGYFTKFTRKNFNFME